MRTATSIPSRARGFTLAEILIVIAIIAVIGLLVLPAMQRDDGLRAAAAAELLASDIEYARTRTIAHPATPIVVSFDLANNRYWLARSDSVANPITRPDTGEPYIIEYGVGRGAAADSAMLSELTNLPESRLRFDAIGSVIGGADCGIRIDAGEEAMQVTVLAATGMVHQASAAPR